MRITRITELESGQRLGKTVRGRGGQVLLAAGVELTPGYINRLGTLGFTAAYVADADTADITPPQTLTEDCRQSVESEMSSAFEAVGRLAADNRRSAGKAAADSFGASGGASKELVAETARAINIIAKRADDLVDQLAKQEVISGLSSLKSHDNYTFQHSIDVAVVGIVLARKAGWDRGRVTAFGVGCLLHDIGKIFIDPKLLMKPGALDADEVQMFKTHPLLGYNLIKSTAPNLGALAPQVALQHHERQDGTGYPRKLKGNNRLGRASAITAAGWIGGRGRRHEDAAAAPIHDFGALSAVADVYDALTSDRPYRAGYHPGRALDAVCGMSGTHLNRDAVELLCRVVPPFPVCSEVRVTSGRYAGWTGIVAAVPPADMSRPRVRLLANGAGERVDPQEVDLAVDRDVTLEPVGKPVSPVVNDEAALGALGDYATSASHNLGRPLPPPVREFLQQFDLNALEAVA